MSETAFVVVGQSERHDNGAVTTWLVCWKRTLDEAQEICDTLNRLAAKMGLDNLVDMDHNLSERRLKQQVWYHGANYTVRAVGEDSWSGY